MISQCQFTTPQWLVGFVNLNLFILYQSRLKDYGLQLYVYALRLYTKSIFLIILNRYALHHYKQICLTHR